MQARAAYLASKTAILENAELSTKTKNRLISVALMESLASGTTARISKLGSIIFTLSDGEKICDTGRSISFSDEARETALDYMTAKWNVKRRSLDRASGDTVYALANGQKVGGMSLNGPPLSIDSAGKSKTGDRTKGRNGSTNQFAAADPEPGWPTT